MKGTIVACAAFAVALAGCSNPLMKAAEAIKADAVSPRIVVSQADATVVASGGSLDCGETVYGNTVDIPLIIKNEGKSALSIDAATISLAMGTGTEAGSFTIGTAPDATIAAGASSTLVLRFSPSVEGTKKATLSIPTNDTKNSTFTVALAGTGSSIVMTTNATSITTTTVTINCSIAIANGLAKTASGICWSDHSDPTIADNCQNRAKDDSSDMITSLSPGTLYYVRAYATIGGITSYGRQLSFVTLPDAPRAPSATVITGAEGSGKLKVDWIAVTGASIYDLYYNSSNNFPSAQTPISTAATTYTVSGLANFTTYYFWIKARNASGSGATSDSGSGAPGVRVTGISLDPTSATIPLGTTRQLDAGISPTTASDPAVTWTSSSASVATVSSSGLVTAIGPGIATISATAAGNVSKTATCAVNVPPAAPVLNTAVTAYGGEVTLGWSASSGATSYNVYYSLSSGAGTGGTKVSGITATNSTVSGLANWSKYYFVVTAVGPGGESAASNERSCIPIRQEIIVVNKGSDSIDFNLFNATAGSVTRPSTGYIFGPNAAATDGAASVAIDPDARNAIYVAYTGTTTSLPGFFKYGYSAANGYASATPYEQHCDGVGPEHLVVVTTPSVKKYLYVAYKAQGFLVWYDIDAAGALGTRNYCNNTRSGVDVSARYLSADPSGKFLFASNYDANTITSYRIDASTGELTEAGYVSSGGSNPYRSVVTPDGNYLLVINYGSGTVVSFAINASTGVLTQQSSRPTMGEGPTGIAIDAAGANVYVCSARNRTNPTLQSGYLNRFTLSGGTLSPVSDWAQTLFGPLDIALDITGTKAIVLNSATTSGGATPEARVYPVDCSTGAVSGYVYSTAFDTGATPNHLIVVKLP